MAEPKTRKTVFSGIQPTGGLHIGNLIGAISLWVREQDRHDSIFCIVDLHALTIPEAIEAERLRANCLDIAALYLACGVDPEKSLVFVQSQVREHAELAWLLAAFLRRSGEAAAERAEATMKGVREAVGTW